MWLAHQCTEEVGCGNRPLKPKLEGFAGIIHRVVVHVAPLGPTAVEVGVRVQLHPPVHDGRRNCMCGGRRRRSSEPILS